MTAAPFPIASASQARRERIGKYDIVYLLAQGGMAGVYVGALSGPADFEKLVAVKVIHPHLAKEKAFAEMFLDEARLAAMIQHPNVAQVDTAGDEDGLLDMVGELISGQDVRALVRKVKDVGAHVSQYLFAHIVSQVCRGLHAAHELRDSTGDPLGLVHRDVSLSNILISYDGQVKLIDFGVAWANKRISKTQAGTVKGKVAFMAPEQIRGAPLDRRTDVFSAAVVLYQLLTGAHPFPAETDSEQMRKIVSAPFEPVRDAAPQVDFELARVVEKALSKEPAGRHADAATMADCLDEACRAARATGLSRRLEQLMTELFATQRREHEEHLRAFHKDRQGAGVQIPLQGLGPNDETDMSSPSKSIWRESRLGRNGLLGVALALALLCAGVVFVMEYEQAAQEAAEPLARAHETEAKKIAPATRVKSGQMRLGLEDDEKKTPANNAGEAELLLTLEPRHAQVLLDGASIDTSEKIVLPADDREHLLVVSAPGYREARRRFRLDSKTLIEIELLPETQGASARRLNKKKSLEEPLREKRNNLLGNPYQ